MSSRGKRKAIGVFTTTIVNSKVKPIIIGLGGVGDNPAVAALLQEAAQVFRPVLPSLERAAISRLDRVDD